MSALRSSFLHSSFKPLCRQPFTSKTTCMPFNYRYSIQSCKPFSNKRKFSLVSFELCIKTSPSRRYFTTSFSLMSENSNVKTTNNVNGKNITSYRVNIISADGKSKCHSLSVADIVRGSSIHARDLFSLSLTSVDEDQKKYDYDTADENEDLMMTSTKRKRKIIMRNPAPVILPRGEKILVCFGHIKAVIDKDEGMIFAAHHPSIQLFSKELSELFKWKSQDNDPFEIRFLEQILYHVCSTWSRRILLYQPIVNNLSEKTINSDSFDAQSTVNTQRLTTLKESMQSFEMQVSQALDCLTALLNDDEDMVQILLTAQAEAAQKGEVVDLRLHESVELLFEEYSRQLQNLSLEMNYLLRRVESKLDMIKMSLDSYRNHMLRVNVYLSIGTLCLATSTTVAGYFGMNLLHGLESSDIAFPVVVGGTTFLSGAVFMCGIHYINSSRINKAAVAQFDEIKTITRALSDLNAVDYAAKCLVESEKDVDKAVFQAKLEDARANGRKVSQSEVDFLFDILDASRDGRLQKEEMNFLNK